MLVLGFVIVGSPAVQREMRMDERRISDLQNIQWEIINYWQLKRILPSSLSDLHNDISGFSVPKDPETDVDYEYQVVSPLKFGLCANFKRESLKDDYHARVSEPVYYEDTYMKTFSGSWSHKSGRVCFEREIDPELYPEK